MTSAERRSHPRFTERRACKLLDPRTGRYLSACTNDVSAGGALVETDRALPCRPGDRLLLAVAFDGATVLGRDRMRPSTIVRVHPGSDRRRVALRFEAVPSS